MSMTDPIADMLTRVRNAIRVRSSTVDINGSRFVKSVVDVLRREGYVEDVRPYVYRSSVFVVPLRMGGGTRLKVLEAMSMKKPIVSTSIGCEGINVRHDESILIADEPEAFAAATIKLLRDAALRERLVEKGYALMKSEYEWEVIGKGVEEIYRHLIARNSQPASRTAIAR